MTDSKITNESVSDNKNLNMTETKEEATTPTQKKTEIEGGEHKTTVADFAEEVKKDEKKEETKSLPMPQGAVGGDNGPVLKNMTDEFINDVMSVPACSESEYRMVTYIIMWCRQRGIRYDFDKKGNIYLTKGEIGEGEFYPCLTSHLDTVQDKQKSYAEAGMRLPLKHTIDPTTKKHKVSIDGMGIGADCRAGITICLAIMEKFDVIKAAFFLEEEIGMRGSKELDVEWFKNVGYVIGYDSPDLNRAAWKCSGYRLFDKYFYEEHLEEICKKHGLTNFKDEPFTDVCQIRDKTNITCMNFGNGGYNAHSPSEYIILEDMDTACGMGIELVEHLGKNFYPCSGGGSWTRNSDGTYNRPKDDDSDEFFRKKFSSYSYYGSRTSYWGGNTGTHSGYQSNNYHYSGGTSANSGSTSSSSGSTSSTAAKSTSTKEADKSKTVAIETVQYISEKYDEQIARIKETISKKCEELGVNFDENFAEAFAEEIKF